MTAFDCVEINPSGQANTSIIWLHGLGADGNDFTSIVPLLSLPAAYNTRFIFPHAPVQAVTINQGMQMRAWFDIYSLDKSGRQDEVGIRAAEQLIKQYIDREHQRGVAYENIILVGFSQGGAVALQTGLRFPHQLAGIATLSGYLPLTDKLSLEASEANKNTPIMMGHGRFDMTVLPHWGKQSHEALQKAGYKTSWHEYDMEHAVCDQEIQQLSQWMAELRA